MGELADEWAAEGGRTSGARCRTVVEMQTEGGAAGAVHGALQAGALATTFTASQGLLLMIPNMYKIAGELTPAVHPRRGALARHAGALDLRRPLRRHGRARQTGFALLASGSVQEAHDFALIAHAATLRVARPVPPLLRRLPHLARGREDRGARRRRPARDDRRRARRARTARARCRPDHPFIRGTAQNPDVFFQAREAVQPVLRRPAPSIVAGSRWTASPSSPAAQYRLFDYVGAPGRRARDRRSWAPAPRRSRETVECADRARREGRRAEGAALPAVLRRRASSPRCRRRPCARSPCSTARRSRARRRAALPGRRHRAREAARRGRAAPAARASSADATAFVQGVHAGDGQGGLRRAGRSRAEATTSRSASTTTSRTRACRTTRRSTIEPDDVVRAVFYGLGADGTVGANKNSIKIIGEETADYAQGYFVYDSKKSGSVTISHLRFGPRPIRSPYLIDRRNFVACHQFGFLERFDVLERPGRARRSCSTARTAPDEVWDAPAAAVQRADHREAAALLRDRRATRSRARRAWAGASTRSCRPASSRSRGVLPRDEAIATIKHVDREDLRQARARRSSRRTSPRWIDTLAHLHEVDVPDRRSRPRSRDGCRSCRARRPTFVQRRHGAHDRRARATSCRSARCPSTAPIRAAPRSGRSATSRSRSRCGSPSLCIQCGKCVLVCPHAVIRAQGLRAGALARRARRLQVARHRRAWSSRT